jgi:hypothetical protein
MELPGPLLVAEVTNQSDRDVAFSYRYEAEVGSSEGSGEGFAPACSVMTESWSQITGTYTLSVDDVVLHEGRLGPGQGDDAVLFVRVRVAPNGEAEIVAPVLRAAAPELGLRSLAGC